MQATELRDSISGYSEGVPSDLKTLLEKSFLSGKDIKGIRDYWRARDVLVVWKKLAETIGQPYFNPDVVFASASAVIEKAKAFDTWMTTHHHELINLQELHLEKCCLTTLPPQIGQLSQLQELYLNLNRLTALPPQIGQLSQLRVLNLCENQLTGIAPQIGQLPNLQVFLT